jgi:hypothetical protein
MAVTTFAEIEPLPENEKAEQREYIRTTKDAFHFVHSESHENIMQRATELENLLDEVLAVALAELLKRA